MAKTRGLESVVNQFKRKKGRYWPKPVMCRAETMSEARRLRIGYALEQKKVHSFIKKSLVSHSQNQGTDFFQIDAAKPLIEQGPFDAIIHKLYGEKWKQQLNEFSSQNPSVVIINSPVAIERLRNRISMLELVKDLKISQENGAVISIPKQILIKKYGGIGIILVIKVSTSANQFGELVADPTTNELLHYTEKPETFVSDRINCVVYVFTPVIFAAIQGVSS